MLFRANIEKTRDLCGVYQVGVMTRGSAEIIPQAIKAQLDINAAASSGSPTGEYIEYNLTQEKALYSEVSFSRHHLVQYARPLSGWGSRESTRCIGALETGIGNIELGDPK